MASAERERLVRPAVLPVLLPARAMLGKALSVLNRAAARVGMSLPIVRTQARRPGPALHSGGRWPEVARCCEPIHVAQGGNSAGGHSEHWN